MSAPLDGLVRVQARIGTIRASLPASGFDRALAAAGTVGAGRVGGGDPMGTPTGALTVDPASLRAARPAALAAGAGGGADVAVWAARLPEAAGPWIGPIVAAADRHGVDPRLLASLVQQESGFRPDARSHAGALGLAQLMPATAAGLGVDPTDPLQNLDGGARYLREQLDRFGSVELALAAYNAGPGRVARAGGIPDIQETRTYVARVTATYTSLGGR